MRKPPTLIIWKTFQEEGCKFHRTRRAAKEYLADMVKEGELSGYKVEDCIATQKPERHEVQIWSGRSLADALFEGINLGQCYPLNI